MNIKIKNSVVAFGGLAVVLLSGNVLAGTNTMTGYYADTSSQPATIQPGSSGDPGAEVAIIEKTVNAGSYLITAQVFGYSYAPNSGAVCYFTENGAESGWRTLNTSSDWSALKTANILMLGKYPSPHDGTKVTVSCIRGYSFTGGAQIYGTMTLVPVQNLE